MSTDSTSQSHFLICSNYSLIALSEYSHKQHIESEILLENKIIYKLEFKEKNMKGPNVTYLQNAIHKFLTSLLWLITCDIIFVGFVIGELEDLFLILFRPRYLRYIRMLESIGIFYCKYWAIQTYNFTIAFCFSDIFLIWKHQKLYFLKISSLNIYQENNDMIHIIINITISAIC